MKLKIFQESGARGVEKLEEEINAWLKRQDVEIRRTETALCGLGESGEVYQGIVISVWYDDQQTGYGS